MCLYLSPLQWAMMEDHMTAKSSLCAVSQKQYCTFIINNFTNMTRVVLLLINQSLMSWTWSRLLRLILSGDLVVLCHHCRDVRDGDTALNYAEMSKIL